MPMHQSIHTVSLDKSPMEGAHPRPKFTRRPSSRFQLTSPFAHTVVSVLRDMAQVSSPLHDVERCLSLMQLSVPFNSSILNQRTSHTILHPGFLKGQPNTAPPPLLHRRTLWTPGLLRSSGTYSARGMLWITLVIYDYALTLRLEVRYIWFSRWNYTKVLFLLVRYLTFVNMVSWIYGQLALNVSKEVCKVVWPLSAWLTVFRTIFAETILCIRTWPIWNGHNVVGTILATAMLAIVALLSFLTYQFTNSLQFAPLPYLGFRGCHLASEASRIFLAAQYITLLAVEIFVFALVLKSLLHHPKS